MSNWTANNIPDLSGKVAIITGANGELGAEMSAKLGAKGAHVVMAVRNVEKGEAARQDALKQHPNATLELMPLDLGKMDSVREFVDAFKARFDRLDILINNAGIMAVPRGETVDGFEKQIGVNHFGHFALTGWLLDLITATPGARVTSVTSTANFFGHINLDDINGEKEYDRWQAYMQSKLANAIWAFELNKRFNAAGVDAIANTGHPGLVVGNLQTNSVQQSGTQNTENILYAIMGPVVGHSAEMGVLPILYAAAATDAKGGAFYGPRWFHSRGYPSEAKANKEAYDADLSRRFWELSEEMTGVTYQLPTSAVV
jgi:protochlorophyllide reductase